MTTITTPTASILCVEVPESYKGQPTIHNDYLFLTGMSNPDRIKLPSGSWEIVGMSDELTEEQAKGIVEIVIGGYRDYEHSGYTWYFKTALKSFDSLLRYHGITTKVLVLKKNKMNEKPTLEDGKPCSNPTCRYHIRTHCETCGRKGMVTPPPTAESRSLEESLDIFMRTNPAPAWNDDSLRKIITDFMDFYTSHTKPQSWVSVEKLKECFEDARNGAFTERGFMYDSFQEWFDQQLSNGFLPSPPTP